MDAAGGVGPARVAIAAVRRIGSPPCSATGGGGGGGGGGGTDRYRGAAAPARAAWPSCAAGARPRPARGRPRTKDARTALTISKCGPRTALTTPKFVPRTVARGRRVTLSKCGAFEMRRFRNAALSKKCGETAEPTKQRSAHGRGRYWRLMPTWTTDAIGSAERSSRRLFIGYWRLIYRYWRLIFWLLIETGA